MKPSKHLSVIFLLMLGIQLAGCARFGGVDRDTLYQTSTINALMEGVYDGSLTLGELGRHGDFGIGTFNRLEGEMICLDGKIYQVKTDGKAYVREAQTKTPFASVTWFDCDRVVPLKTAANLDEFKKLLDAALPSPNIFYAIKIEGTFDYLKTRSVPAQQRPYPRLADVAKKQAVFEFKKVTGTLVGFRCPEFANGLNVPGYHLHFLTADKTAGGHVLDLRATDIQAQVDETHSIFLSLNADKDFYTSQIGQDKREELKKIE